MSEGGRRGTLLLQLERLGDLAQTLPALSALVAGGEEVTLVVRERIAPWARAIVPSGVDLRVLGDRRLASVIEALAEGRAELRAATTAAREEIGAPRPARVVNLTWHAAGAALAVALGAPRTGGPVLTPQGERLARGFWGAYPIAAWDARPEGRVPMTDVRRLLVEEFLGRRLDTPPATDPRTPLEGPAGLVVGAGDPLRIWPEAAWAELAAALARAGRRIVLIGGPADRERAAAVARAAERLGAPVENRAGRLAPAELVSWLHSAALVVGSDTGPTHVAAALGIPVVMLMGGSAHVWETGPCGAGALALQRRPVGSAAMDAIAPGDVAAAALARLGGGPLPVPAQGTVLYRARPATDPLGGTVFDGEEAPVDTPRLLLAAAGAIPGRRPEEGRLEAALLREGCGAETAWAAAHDLACEADREARRAAERLAAGQGPAAAAALDRASRALDRLAERLASIPGARLLAACLRVGLENLPPGRPDEVVAALGRLTRRYEAATALAIAPLARA